MPEYQSNSNLENFGGRVLPLVERIMGGIVSFTAVKPISNSLNESASALEKVQQGTLGVTITAAASLIVYDGIRRNDAAKK